MKLVLSLFALTFLVLVGNTFAQESPFNLSTNPQGAEVWVNGALIGTTPLEISSRQIQNLDIELDGYLDVKAEDLSVETDLLTIDLLPSGIDGFLFYQKPIFDWRYVANDTANDLFLLDLVDPSQHRVIWPYTDPFKQPDLIGEIPYSPVISPNGDLVTYLATSYPAPKCVFKSEQIWLSSLANPEQRTSLLDYTNADIPGCSNAHGFSPNQQLVWVKINPFGNYADYQLIIIPVTKITEDAKSVATISERSPVIWADDSYRVAFVDDGGSPLILKPGVYGWESIPLSIAGTPVTWSNIHYRLWLIEDRSGIGNSTLTLVETNTNEVLQTIDLSLDYGSFRNLVWNSDGTKFAVVVVEANDIRKVNEDELSYLVIVDVTTGKATQIPSSEFEFPLFWVDDGTKLALLMNASDRQDETEPIVRIISVP